MRTRQQTQPEEHDVPASVPPEPDARPGDGRSPENQGYAVFGYLVSGMVAYGLIGWLVAWLTHWTPAIPIGAIAGLVLAVVGVFYKYGRP
jgi:hypothetical protein